MNVQIKTFADDTLDTESEQFTKPSYVYAAQQLVRVQAPNAIVAPVGPSESLLVPLPKIYFNPPIFTNLFSGLNDVSGNSHMFTDVTF